MSGKPLCPALHDYHNASELKKVFHPPEKHVALLTTGNPLAGLGMHAERVMKSDPTGYARMCCTLLKKSVSASETRSDRMSCTLLEKWTFARPAALRCRGLRQGLPARRQAQAQRKMTTLRYIYIYIYRE